MVKGGGKEGGRSHNTYMVHSAVMLVLLDVSWSTELNISSSRSVCVAGTSTCKTARIHVNLARFRTLSIRDAYGVILALQGSPYVLHEPILPVTSLDRSHHRLNRSSQRPRISSK